MPFIADDPDPAQPDEVKCDRCGMPTPKLHPPERRPLCDRCYQRMRDELSERASA
jgi:formylmethanofuran dehydrogenase subunit E